MSELPRLIPITRRVPGSFSGGKSTIQLVPDLPPQVDSGQADVIRLENARQAVRKALQGPATRWWSWTMLLIRFRLWLQSRSFRAKKF